jgi:ribose transport system ATP-binding protein
VASVPHIVEIAGVTKTFPGVLALDRIHVGFRADEVHAVVGENGAGKSALMHILAGDLQPTEGEILVDGKATRSRRRSRAAPPASSWSIRNSRFARR